MGTVPVAERILLHKGNELVTFASLSDEEKNCVKRQVFTILADGFMEPQGYRRKKEITDENNN